MAAAAGDLSSLAVITETTVPIAAAEIFALWTDSERMSEWLVESSRIELRIGGPFELHFDRSQPDGLQGSEGCCFLAWLPERMLAFTWNAPPSFPAIRGQRTWVVVDLTEAGGSTTMRITHLGWPASGWTDGSAWPEVYAYFERAWGMVCAAMERHAAQR